MKYLIIVVEGQTEYLNPEDINSQLEKAPSKRILEIKSNYEKVILLLWKLELVRC